MNLSICSSICEMTFKKHLILVYFQRKRQKILWKFVVFVKIDYDQFLLLNISDILVWIALLGIHSNVDLFQLVLYLNCSVNYSLCTIFIYLEVLCHHIGTICSICCLGLLEYVNSSCQQRTETNTDDNLAWVA